jgi:ERCC4-type nuclease
MKVTIDSRETNRIQSASKYFKEQGLEVSVEELPIGDYIFSNGKEEVVFEFKLTSDFVSSIQNGRIFNQAINQSENYDYHFVIIHGDLATRSKCLAMSRNYIPVTVYQYLGAIASLNRYTTVIETYSPYLDESYYRMMTQARKCLSDKPVVKKFPKKHKNTALNFLTYTIYGINYKKAQLIVDTYNLESLTDLMKLTKEELCLIEGIGEKTATNIIEAIHGDKK